MRTDWQKIVLIACTILVMTGWGVIYAADVNKPEPNSMGPGPGGPMQARRHEPGTEQVQWILEKIKESNPEKANELIQLREKDPNAFRMELRKYMREQFERMREHGMEPGKMQRGPEGQMPGGPEMMREQMQERSEEYMKWLGENFPDEAAKLKQLKEENPEQYMKALMISGRKYHGIFEASRENPQLAAALKEQMALKEKREGLLKQIKAATDEKQKKELTGQLEQVVGQQYDVIVKRKELAYGDLTKKLAELQKEVDKRKTEVEQWKKADYKKQQVKLRVNGLLSDTERFEWE